MFNIAWVKAKDKKQLDLIIEMLGDIVWKLEGEKHKTIDEDLLDRVSEIGLKESYEMNTQERKDYVSSVSVAFEKIVKPKIDKLIFQQKEYIASKGLKDEFEFDRGTMNGILTVFEEFEKDHLEHLDNVKPVETFDKHELFSELTK